MSIFQAMLQGLTNKAHVAPGDCGSWVIDEHGNACAMVVAAGEDDDEVYCLPLAPIFRNIQELVGSDKEPEIPSDEQVAVRTKQKTSVSGTRDASKHLVSNGSSSGSSMSSRISINGHQVLQRSAIGHELVDDSALKPENNHSTRTEPESAAKSSKQLKQKSGGGSGMLDTLDTALLSKFFNRPTSKF